MHNCDMVVHIKLFKGLPLCLLVSWKLLRYLHNILTFLLPWWSMMNIVMVYPFGFYNTYNEGGREPQRVSVYTWTRWPWKWKGKHNLWTLQRSSGKMIFPINYGLSNQGISQPVWLRSHIQNLKLLNILKNWDSANDDFISCQFHTS